MICPSPFIVANEDYEHVRVGLDFSGSQFASISVQISNDSTVEYMEEEYFMVRLTSYNGPSRIIPENRTVNITIVDDDGNFTYQLRNDCISHNSCHFGP